MPEDTGTVETDAPTTPEDGPTEAPVESTEETTSEETPDYEKRYEDLRANHNRIQNLNTQYEQVFQDPAQLARAVQALGISEQELLQHLGYDTEGDDEEEDYVDPNDQRLASIEQWATQQQQAQQQAEMADLENQLFAQEIASVEKSEGRKLTDQELDAIWDLGQRRLDHEGIPQFQDAHKFLSGLVESRQKEYVKSKKAPSVDLGQPGSESIDLSDESKRLGASAELIQAALDAEE